MVKVCVQCGGEFSGMHSVIGKRQFCSRRCSADSRVKARRAIECAFCKKEFTVYPAWDRDDERKFCSRSCSNQGKTRTAPFKGKTLAPETIVKLRESATGRMILEKHPHWKGGKIRTKVGYVSVYVKVLPADAQAMAHLMYPNGCYRGYILEHRLNAAMMLGRPIAPHEVVHHRNGVKDDNRPENLLVTTHAEHAISHRDAEKELISLRQEVAALRAEKASRAPLPE